MIYIKKNSAEYKYRQLIKNPTLTDEAKQQYQHQLERYKNQQKLKSIVQLVAIYKKIENIYQNAKDIKGNYASGISFVSSSMKRRVLAAKTVAEGIFDELNKKDNNFELKTDYIETRMKPQEREEKINKLKQKSPFFIMELSLFNRRDRFATM
ncbi:hypothetical protein [Candidatus Phytoplasma fraxini]|uniref:Uncharacterized protein n=1 Tax=Ash yellows phytoplasma TaxID=35780 RepID=A0ABZ2U8Z4_ASHYP